MNTRQFAPESSYFSGVLKIALGVFIGALAALLAYEGITALRVEVAMRKAAAEVQRSADVARERARSQLDAKRAREADEASRRDASERAKALAARLAAEREQRRADAWARFYQPSEPCRLDSATLACANEHMAARKRFDAQYIDR